MRRPQRRPRSSPQQEQALVALARAEPLMRGDLEASFRQIAKAAAQMLKVRRAGIWKYGRGHVLLRCECHYDLARGRFAHGEQLVATEYPSYFRALDNEVVIAAADALADPRTRELGPPYLAKHDIRSMLDAPILVGGRLWGVLCLESVGRKRRWSPTDKLYSRALGDTAALALESARRREAAEELRRRETYFRSLIERVSELVVVFGADGRFRYLSPALESAMGFRPEDVVGHTFFEYLHPHDVARLSADLQRLKADRGGSIPFAARLRHADGSWRHIEGSARNLLDDDAVAGIVANGRDTTERRWAENGVRTLLAVSQDVGGTIDSSLLLRRVLRRARQVVAASFAAVYLRNDEGAMHLAAQQGLALPLSEGRRAALERLADEAPDSARNLGLESVIVVPLSARGRRLGTLVLGRDSSEPFEARHLTLLEVVAKELASGLDRSILYRLRQEEAELSSSLLHIGYELLAASDASSLADRLCALTVEALECDFSRTFFLDEDQQMLRRVAHHGDTAEELRALQLIPVAAPGVASLLDVLERDGIGGRQQLPEFAGRFGWAHVVAVALRHQGRLLGVHVAGKRTLGCDFTALQRRLLTGIAQMASLSLQNLLLVSRLEQASRVKSDFVSMMSHELRTPLNIVLGYTGLLREGAFGPLRPEQETPLERVESSASSLLDLVNTTLDLSQLERGDVVMTLGEVDLESLVHDVEQQCRAVLVRPAVAFRADIPADLPRLRTDAGKLRVVVANLVANALRFTEVGEVSVSARVAGDTIEISVADTGIGIALAAQATIFEAFRQAESTPTLQQGGVGLGLYVVSRLLVLLQGSVELSSAEGQGSTFRIRLPLAI